MESMSIMGFIAFFMAAGLMSLPGKVNALNKRINKLSKLVEGDKSMSKLLEKLVGKKCKINVSGGGIAGGIVGVVVEVDDDWVKLELDSKKGKKQQLYPIDNIDSIEVLE